MLETLYSKTSSRKGVFSQLYQGSMTNSSKYHYELYLVEFCTTVKYSLCLELTKHYESLYIDTLFLTTIRRTFV